MVELELDGVLYRTGVLNVFEQISMVKRLAPLLSGMGEAFAKLPTRRRVNGEAEPGEVGNGHDEDGLDGEAAEEGVPEGEVWGALHPMMAALSEMKDEDLHFVVRQCLSKAMRLDGQRWARLMSGQGTNFMYPVDINVALQITFETVRENLENFFGARQQTTTGEEMGQVG